MSADAAVVEQALLLRLRLEVEFGTEAEREEISKLEEALQDAVAGSGAGELDGDEFGQGLCTISIYGPSADSLFDAIFPALTDFPVRPGSSATKRYGEPGAPEETVPLGGLNTLQ